MKVLSWLPVAALLLVIGDQFARRNESPEVRALRAGLQDLPLTPAETAQVIDAYKHRDDPSVPMDITGTARVSTQHHRLLRPGRVRVHMGLFEGAFYLFDARLLEAWTAERWDRSMEAALVSPHGVGVFDGVVTVSACQSGDNPLDVHLTEDGPARAAPGATRFDLDLPSGRLALQDNGDSAVQSVIRMPPGRGPALACPPRTGHRRAPDHRVRRRLLGRAGTARARRYGRRPTTSSARRIPSASARR